MNLPEFADEFLAAFLGFLSAMLVEFIYRRVDSRSRAKRVMTELVDELRVNKTTVNALGNEQAYPSPYQLSSWKRAQFTGDLAELRGVKGSDSLLRAFATLEEASILERSLFETYLLGGERLERKGWNALREETMRSRDSVKQTIDVALAEWGE